MKKKLFLALMLGLLTVSSHAALPPQYQRTAEFRSIFEDANVANAFPYGAFIDRVEYVRRDLYRVSAGQCSLYITLKDQPLPEGMVGARRFSLEIGKADCPAD